MLTVNFPFYPGNIAKNEFRPEKIMEYVSRLRKTNNKVKGRHSNQTWLYGPEYEQLEQTLIRRYGLTQIKLNPFLSQDARKTGAHIRFS